ncbi:MULTISPECIES: hypothetical protein [Bacillus]|uniref:hypothetical protein n=1 Tax=Bacillus TaxID=1386 RepID=UPI00061A867F|nr:MULTISPECIES: hypothetical protein [Bacillus]AKD30278.1 hypothetical protein AW02_021290 [Bacillus velezensis NJN-6]AZI47376.1 hypothetical protein BVMH_10910 [Bacillus velezensis]MBB4873852.1 hypothetical protein [Bacillus velezensis]MBE1279877.1 hypothetical protein [Bacillus sp. Bvel1]MBW8600417.1 hypothetical protein [Bacillus amyloliquefaciens]
MIQAYKYGEDFIFIGPSIISEVDEQGNYIIPENCTLIQPPSFFKPKFDPSKQVWVEAATREEKDAILEQAKSVREPTAVDILKQQNAAIMEQLAEAQSAAEEQSKILADLLLMLAEGGKA